MTISTRSPILQPIAIFDTAPARYTRPDRLAAATGLPLPVAGVLLGRARFAERLSLQLIARLGLPPCRDVAIGAQDRALALQPPENIAGLPRLFGCLWHAAAIRHVIARDSRRALIDAIGADLHAFILRNPQADRPQEAGAAVSLLERIDGDGAVLVEYWLDGLPPAFAERLRLMLPVGSEHGYAMPPPAPAALAAIVASALLWHGCATDV